jgi:Uma2 family endonuclease
MAAVPKLAPSRMTVEEFLDWPGDGSGRKFQLVDGEPLAMAPASVTHGITQANVVGLLRNHLTGSRCYVVVAPGVIPRVRSEANLRIPDVAVTCETDDQGLRALTEPTLVVEILSPSNEAETRENVWAYATIATVREILLIRSTRLAAELIRREADGTWPANSQPVGADAALVLESLDFSCPLAAVYEGTHLTRATSGS